MGQSLKSLSCLAAGVAAGFAGTLAIQGLRTANQRWLPETMPPLRQEPGEFMVEAMEEALPDTVRDRTPDIIEYGASRLLGLGYGLTFGALYAVARPAGGDPLREGTALGLACWAAGYVGWLPAAGLMPPVWRQHPAQILLPAVQHVLYGVVTVATYNSLRGSA